MKIQSLIYKLTKNENNINVKTISMSNRILFEKMVHIKEMFEVMVFATIKFHMERSLYLSGTSSDDVMKVT